MSAYQQKWIEVLQNAKVPGWSFTGHGQDIIVTVPNGKDIKELANNLEMVLANVSLDINLPKERIKFIIKNSLEEVDYIFNPGEQDLIPMHRNTAGR